MEHLKFRDEFKNIIYHKGLITNNANYLKKLHAFDKNDSHKKAIVEALEQRKQLHTKLNQMLKGLPYEDWKKTSKKISVLTSKIKNCISKKQKAELELQNIILP